MINRSSRIYFSIFALTLATVLIIACGKKAPPVAPRSLPLVGVSDLQGSLNQSTVRLTWRHTPETLRAAGYIVLRAQSALSKPECPDCPKVFQKVETISLSRSSRKKPQVMEFYQDVTVGFRYTYNVRPYLSSGAQGPDSNLVVIALPKE